MFKNSTLEITFSRIFKLAEVNTELFAERTLKDKVQRNYRHFLHLLFTISYVSKVDFGAYILDKWSGTGAPR